MSGSTDIILAHHIKAKAISNPDFDVATFVTIGSDGALNDEVRTYRDLWENGQRLAKGLQDEGQEQGEAFGLIMQNHPEFVDLMVASSIAGTVFAPIDPQTKGKKLIYMLDFAECTGVVIADYAWENLKQVLPDLPRLKWVWVLGEIKTDDEQFAVKGRPVKSLQDIQAQPLPNIKIAVNDPSKTMQLLYTSGTTGDPKAIASSYERLAIAAMLPSIFGLTKDDRPYTGLSLTHANAQLITLVMALYSGMRCVISRKFTKSRLWDITREYDCTVFNLLGGMTTAIYSEPLKDNDQDNPVRLVISAGMPKAIWEEFGNRFGVDIFEFYGAAEGGLTFNPPRTGPIGSIGKAPPTMVAKIVDKNDLECPPGEPGEIVFQNADGSSPIVNYLKNSKATEKKTRAGWLRMGDVGYADGQGWLFFLYRDGGGIRRNGDFVNPAFVEKEIAEHPEVDDVFVYGIKMPTNTPGEKEVVAAIMPKDPASFDPQPIFAACREKLESNYVPSFIQIVDEIPKTASEKPQERFLLDAFDLGAKNIVKNQ